MGASNIKYFKCGYTIAAISIWPTSWIFPGGFIWQAQFMSDKLSQHITCDYVVLHNTPGGYCTDVRITIELVYLISLFILYEVP